MLKKNIGSGASTDRRTDRGIASRTAPEHYGSQRADQPEPC